MMRAAVLLIGNIRTIDVCSTSLKSFLSSMQCHVDVFVGTYDLRFGYHPYVSQSTKFISDEILSSDEIRDMLEPLSPQSLIIDNHAEYFKKMSSLVGPGFLPHEYGSLMQYFKMYDIVSDIKDHENTNGFKYDILLKTRCDLTYSRKVPFDIDFQDQIVIDEGNVFPNDCVFGGSRDSMINIIEEMVSLCKNTKVRTNDVTKDIPHGLLNTAARNCDLKFVAMPLIRAVVRWNSEVLYPPLPSRLKKATI